MPHPQPHEIKRLKSAQRLINKGEPDRAEFDLQDWCDNAPHEAHAPAPARVLLAALLARRGEMLRARVVLGEPQRRDTYNMDAAEGRLAVSLLVSAGLESDARRLAAWLHHLHGHDPATARWIQLFDIPGLGELPQATDNHVQRLADELSAQPEVVPSLVFAQRQRPQSQPLSLLRGALQTIAYGFEGKPEFVTMLQALAETAELLGDDQDARRWAHRGLQQDPYNATLALLLGRLEDDESVGPPAQQALKRVSLKFPQYRDVQQAFETRQRLDRQANEREAA